MQTVEITVPDGSGSYVVAMTVKDARFFEYAAGKPDIVSKDGEELVYALMDASQGDITSIERRKRGHMNDGVNGEAAQVLYHPDGKIRLARRFKHGKLDDGATDPAIMEFNQRGLLIAVRHYRDDLLNDPAKGNPAFIDFNDSGERIYYGFYKNGVKTAEKFKLQIDAEREGEKAKESVARVKTAFGNKLKFVP